VSNMERSVLDQILDQIDNDNLFNLMLTIVSVGVLSPHCTILLGVGVHYYSCVPLRGIPTDFLCCNVKR
jgi:hypothetical protein